MTSLLLIREANPREAKFISRLAIRSKAYWGYSSAFMQACTSELTMTSSDIENHKNHYEVAIINNEIMGFYSLENLTGVEIELSALFVDPTHIGTGIGRQLMESVKNYAISIGAQKINIQGDPHAEKFYLAAGGKLTGTKESESIPGRYLPLFQIKLTGPVLQNKSEQSN